MLSTRTFSCTNCTTFDVLFCLRPVDVPVPMCVRLRCANVRLASSLFILLLRLRLKRSLAGTDFWGLLNPDWKLCDKGHRQSPIDIMPSNLLYDPFLRPLSVDKQRVSAQVSISILFRLAIVLRSLFDVLRQSKSRQSRLALPTSSICAPFGRLATGIPFSGGLACPEPEIAIPLARAECHHAVNHCFYLRVHLRDWI